MRCSDTLSSVGGVGTGLSAACGARAGESSSAMRDARRLMLYNDISFACGHTSDVSGACRAAGCHCGHCADAQAAARSQRTLALLPGEMGDRAGLCGETGDLAPTGCAACCRTSAATRPGCQMSAGAARLSAAKKWPPAKAIGAFAGTAAFTGAAACTLPSAAG